MSKSINQIKTEIENAKAEYHKALGVLTALKEQALHIGEIKERMDAGEDLSSALRSTIEDVSKEINELQKKLDNEIAEFTSKYEKFLGDRQ